MTIRDVIRLIDKDETVCVHFKSNGEWLDVCGKPETVNEMIGENAEKTVSRIFTEMDVLFIEASEE